MKHFLSIMSIYLLFLTVLPCHCEDLLGKSKLTQTEYASFQNGPNEDAGFEKDICTPFCSCSGFHYPNFIVKQSCRVLFDFSSTKKEPIYLAQQTSSYSQSLWQPPQV